jgi:zinc and cadmium transporter
MIEAIVAAVLISLASVVGVLFFGHDKRLIGVERFVIPVAAGMFLSLVLTELIPETNEASAWGGVVVMIGFVSFYVLAHHLHRRYHHLEGEECDRKGAAALLLVGDGIHNFADGIVLGGAFLISPTVGVATAIGLALHEIPQEIVEFGVLLRAGYTKTEAAVRNFISASTVILGTVVVYLLSFEAHEYVWILIGLAAGNLLYLAASDLLPRVHGGVREYGGFWYSTGAIVFGFVLMTALLAWVHAESGHNLHAEDASWSDHGHELTHSDEEED